MADKEQLEILKRGVNDWNIWRINNYEKNIDLNDAKLIDVDLQSVIFKNTTYNNDTKWPKRFDPKQRETIADKEQFEVLKRGVEVWNQWRKDNDDKYIDLISANLSGADLSGVDLMGADLSGVKFIGANLSDANLFGAKLIGTDLFGADLFGADLFSANLFGAKLISADLFSANLFGANLINADLFDTDLQNTIFKNTKYNKYTKWPKRFDSKKVEGLVLCD